ncbi:hypothetical protein [Amycolatopsis sp. NPDC004079]|uniref:hypothetical protein n=1 Tax=Amycolatopsis sp. NPDC004079 TaxID=3154549 RepID=UPI0033BEE6AB
MSTHLSPSRTHSRRVNPHTLSSGKLHHCCGSSSGYHICVCGCCRHDLRTAPKTVTNHDRVRLNGDVPPPRPAAPRRQAVADTLHVPQWSSGIQSWAVARMVVEAQGRDNVVLLFADTRAEDADNYRFNTDASALLGVPLTVVRDGRTPQEVNRDERWLGNSRLAPCSHELKQKVCRKWLQDNTDPASTILYVGVDWTEPERRPAIERMWAPWPVEFPLMSPPYRPKDHWLRESRAIGLEPPSMYRRGYAHANCGGACVRGGQAQWAHLLRDNPSLYASWERHEAEMSDLLGREVSVLRDRRGGASARLPLAVLRRRAESGDSELFDPYDWGGCGCMVDTIGGAA